MLGQRFCRVIQAQCGEVGAAPAGGAKKRAVKLTGDSKVFEEGQLGEAPGGGSLTTYKELSALATEMGQPDLLYKFMDLANHASAMASTQGAAFGCVSLYQAWTWKRSLPQHADVP